MHEQYIRAAVTKEAESVRGRISDIGLSAIVDEMESLIEVPVITDEVRGDIEARIHGTYRAQLVEAETNAYRVAIAKAEAEGQKLAADTFTQDHQDKLVADMLLQANKAAEHAYCVALREAQASHCYG